MNNDLHITLDQELRRDIDGIRKRLMDATVTPIKGNAPVHRFSAERLEALKSLQLAGMWLDMDLKQINTQPQ